MSDDSVDTLVGKIVTKIEIETDCVVLRFAPDRKSSFTFWHDQDCCEHVNLHHINGNILDVLDSKITSASEVIKENAAPDGESYDDSNTASTYTLVTENGTVVFQWYGSSNGYYSERVDMKYQGP